MPVALKLQSSMSCVPEHRSCGFARRRIVAAPRSSRDKPAAPRLREQLSPREENPRFDNRAWKSNLEGAAGPGSKFRFLSLACVKRSAADRGPDSESQTGCKCVPEYLQVGRFVRASRPLKTNFDSGAHCACAPRTRAADISA